MKGRRLVTVLVVLGAVIVVLSAAPVWSRWLGRGPRPLAPRGTRVVLASGHGVNVLDEGAGPPIVLVHGLPGSAYDWQPLPEQLVAAGFRVIRYDRVGYGYADRRTDDERHSIERNAAELLELMTALGIESPVFVGWSYGGGVALRAATDAPERIRGLVLVGSIGPLTDAGVPSSFAPVLRRVRRWAIASGFPARGAVRVFGRLAFSGAPPAWWHEHALSVVASPGVLDTWMQEAAAMDVRVLRPERVNVPVAVLQGTADHISPSSVAGDMHRRIRGSTLVEIPSGSHMLPNTHPSAIVGAVRLVER